jgi:hypothetical protein
MPAWLSPDASNRHGAEHIEDALPPPTAIRSEEQASPTDDQAETIDVTGFLSADDLPGWIRHIADPTIAEATSDPTSALMSNPQPPAQPPPPPLARIGSRASRPAPASSERPAAKPAAAASVTPIERVPPVPPPIVAPRSPGVAGRSSGISPRLLLFVAILAAVAIAGYTIYLVSFT